VIVFWPAACRCIPHFANTSTNAIFKEDFSLTDIRNPDFNTPINATIHFTLTEAVSYFITGTFVTGPEGAGSLGANIGTVAPGFLFGSSVQAFVPGVFQPAPLTGTFAPEATPSSALPRRFSVARHPATSALS